MYNECGSIGRGYKCFDPRKDELLQKPKQSDDENNILTRWFNIGHTKWTDFEVLSLFQENFGPFVPKTLVSPLKREECSYQMEDWCKKNNLELVDHSNMTGSERDWVIAFVGDNFGNLEIFSRAKQSLIIVTRYVTKSISDLMP